SISYAQLQSTPREDLWFPNGTVNAIAVADGVVYIGGRFDYVGPRTGNTVAVDVISGTNDSALPEISGNVYAIVPDGAGGWYVGGEFTAIGNVPRTGLAHISPDRTLDVAWNPVLSIGTPGISAAPVYALALDGTNVYAGGRFTSVFRVDRNTGAVTTLTTDLNDTVSALALSGTALYIGGFFTRIGGSSISPVRNYIAALDTATGLPTPWDPNADGPVQTLAVEGTIVYAGGDFTMIGGQPRSRLAALSTLANTDNATAWNSDVSHELLLPRVLAVGVAGRIIYVGGEFTTIGGESRNNLAAVDANDGTPTSWNPGADGIVRAIFATGPKVYVAGDFQSVGSQPGIDVAEIDALSGITAPWNTRAVLGAFALARSGDAVLAGGEFNSVGGKTREHAAAIDLLTGMATDWDLVVDGPVNAIAVSGSAVYIGGRFSNLGGLARNNVGAVSATTGAPTAWDPNADAAVRTLAIADTTVYVGGDFNTIGGQTRKFIAALDAVLDTNNAAPWNPNATYAVDGLTVSGPTVYAIGGFYGTGVGNSIGGQVRNWVAALDSATGLATAWNPAPNGPVSALAAAAESIYVGGEFTVIGGQARNRIAALNPLLDTNNATGWNPNANAPVRAIAAAGGSIYAGGDFTSIGGQMRQRLAALDTAANTNNALEWNPGANDRIGAIVAAGTNVHVGGAFDQIGGSPRRGLAAFTSLGDSDGDGDIDLTDYAQFAACLLGPGNPSTQAPCPQFDFDVDADVDLFDFGEFELLLTGAP
ncbi:MAG TPA: hypothetical protein VGM03_11205, partial [Phycisphaerae bacterium]